MGGRQDPLGQPMPPPTPGGLCLGKFQLHAVQGVWVRAPLLPFASPVRWALLWGPGCRPAPAAGGGGLGRSLCCPASPDGWGRYLVVDEDFHGIVAPLDEDQLVGLARHGVGEGRAHPGGRAGLEPHAHGEGVHLGQALLHLGVHVVGPQRERELELVSGAVVLLTWKGQDTVPSSAPRGTGPVGNPRRAPLPPPPALGSQEQTLLHSTAAQRGPAGSSALPCPRAQSQNKRADPRSLRLLLRLPYLPPRGGWGGGGGTMVAMGREWVSAHQKNRPLVVWPQREEVSSGLKEAGCPPEQPLRPFTNISLGTPPETSRPLVSSTLPLKPGHAAVPGRPSDPINEP